MQITNTEIVSSKIYANSKYRIFEKYMQIANIEILSSKNIYKCKNTFFKNICK